MDQEVEPAATAEEEETASSRSPVNHIHSTLVPEENGDPLPTARTRKAQSGKEPKGKKGPRRKRVTVTREPSSSEEESGSEK